MVKEKMEDQHAKSRREEIVDACAKLYETMSFRDINIKEIAALTSFSRPSIYNYFQTKEEIFLALFARDYDAWAADVDAQQPEAGKEPRLDFAEKIAATLARRERLLKLLSSNLYDMEGNSRLENLVEFKKSYGPSIEALRRCMQRFFPDMEQAERENFISVFFPFVYGIYPYAMVTEEQRQAMEQAGVHAPQMSIYELALLGIKELLGI